jgi:hypothetical protein
MRIHKKNLFASGVLVLLFLLVISPVFCTAASYSVRWEIEMETNSPRGFSVDVDDNLHFSYWNSDETENYFSKVSKEGIELFDKIISPKPNYITYLIDDFGEYYFIDIDEPINPWFSIMGKEFTISKYSNELVYYSTIRVNLSSYFEGNSTGHLYYIDSECIYFAIWEYQTDYYDLDSIQLAKYNTVGEKLWNRTLDLNPTYNPYRPVFGFCKNSYGNIYVENDGVLYYLDDEDGTDIWQHTIVIDEPTIQIDEPPYLIAFKENVLIVYLTLGQRVFLKFCYVDGNFDWELVIEPETNNRVFTSGSIAIEGDFLGITTLEEEFVYDEGEKTSIIHLHLLNSAKEVLYEERIEFTDEVAVSSDILRYIKILPTSEGHFYRYELMRDRENDKVENTIQYCIPRTNFITGYTLIISISSISILVLLIAYRRKISK